MNHTGVWWAGSQNVDISYIYSRLARPNEDASDIPDEFWGEVARLGDLEASFKDAFGVEEMKDDHVLNWLKRSSLVGKRESVDIGEGFSDGG